MKLALRCFAGATLAFCFFASSGIGPLQAQDLNTGLPTLPQIERGPNLDVKSFASQSSLILRGRVIKGEPRWVGKVIYTFYDVAVEETIKGLPHKTVAVAVPGGALGKVQLIVPQAPKLAGGDQIVLFGERFKGDSSAYQPLGTLGGLVPVHSKAGEGATVAARGTAEPLEDFLKDVRSLSAQK